VARFPECAGAGDHPREAGLAHRLDAGTSGVLLAARDAEIWTALRGAFHEGRVDKRYLALVVGVVSFPGELSAPIAHDRARGGVRVCGDPDDAARREALPALTRWEPVERLGGFTLLRCAARTGRMHQIRAHLAHAGTPVAGDERYGIRVAGVPAALVGFFLHAERAALEHPATGAALDVTAPLPADRAAALAELRAQPR
jgi:23S rRNA-/tRNA-specific pseudouridylate synthase